MADLVTPVTPAAILGHVDAAPRAVAIRDCGWHAHEIARVFLGWHGSWEIAEAQRQAKKLDEICFALNDINCTFYDVPPTTGMKSAFSPMISPLLKKAREAFDKAEEHLFTLLEKEGVKVSMSAWNADTDVIIIYGPKGKPLGAL